MLESVPGGIFNILCFLVMVTPLVVLHEFGHFAMARLCGVKVERFSIGFGRALLSHTTKSGMEWRLAWIPLGGYVKFAGDPNSASGVPDAEDLADLKRAIVAAEGPRAERRYFHFKPVWQRALIVAAGPATNFVIAVVIFAFFYSIIGVRVEPARIGSVAPGSPAAAAGLLTGDVIVSVEGVDVEGAQEVVQDIALRSGTPTRLGVQRGEARLTLTATPQRSRDVSPDFGMRVGRLGVTLAPDRKGVRTVRYPPDQAVVKGAVHSWRILNATLTYVGRVVVGKENGSAIGGPIRMASASGQVVREAAASAPGHPAIQAYFISATLLQMAAIVSVSLGFLNLLPIPVLDGGHLLFYAYEAVARKPLGVRVQEAGFRIGLALLAGLMLFATWNDLHPLMLSVFKNLGGRFS
jgi:regulator of sigma E protease